MLAVSYERIHRSNMIDMGVLPGEVTVRVDQDGQRRALAATVRIETPAEAAYFRHGGILPYS